MLKALLIGLVRLYQWTLGRVFGGQCRFHPSCSEYAVSAIKTSGALRGTGLAIWRVLRCAPWTAGGVDYPPKAVRLDG